MPVPVPDGYDLTNPDIYESGVPLDEFAWLRKAAPVFWNAQTVESSSFDDGGLWVVSRHADVKSCRAPGRAGRARRTPRYRSSTAARSATRSDRSRSR